MWKFFFFLIFLLFLGFFLWQGIYLPKDLLGDEKLFLVERGQNVFQIAENLQKEGLIKDKYFFNFYVLIQGEARKLQAGKYELSSGMNIAEIAQKIISGDIAKIRVTIPEGYNIEQIDVRLTEVGLIERGELVDFDTKNFQFPAALLQKGGIQSNPNFQFSNLEGFMFPDTYYFLHTMEIEEIVKVFLDNFDKKLSPKLREEIEKQNKTVFEIITMASMIQKEIYNTEECKNCKNLVSGILWKRLEKGMPLQVDATIGYITGKRTIKILSKDLRIDSPYNTYKYLGLPIGPISNPGLESILASLYPEDSNYWYFLSTPESKTIFSKTLEEHILAREKYLN